MLQLPGARALSSFRIAKLLARLSRLEPVVSSLEARFIHFVDSGRPLDAAELGILQQLLTYGPRLNRGAAGGSGTAQPVGSDTVLIVPRAGTISPWSSKATDIAHVCGLTAIRRIERGIEYRVFTRQPLGPERLAGIAPVLFDRMTEMVLFNAEHAERLFGHSAPKPLARIDQGTLESANRELGLALSAQEIEYLVTHFQRLGR